MSAVAEVPDQPPVPAAPVVAPAAGLPALRQRLQALDRKQRLQLGAGLVLLLAAVLAAVLLNRQPDYRVLFANLSDKDGGAIVAQLATMNVPYKYTEGGGAIMVPTERVHDVRLKLATLGLPKGSVTGFELMENAKFGVTQFQERLNFQRGLEGELTRSIQALDSVQSARVHLALPNQNGFFREQQKPSASVLLGLYPGRFLDRAQIAGIVHLVASSVPELRPQAVSVVDDTGKLLSQAPEGSPGNGGSSIDVQQVQYVQKLEEQYQRRILDILEPVVGRGNVKAQVTAEVDFSQTEQTSEQHRPNLAQDASAVRSQQVVESGGPGTVLPSGIPGAVSNQPPQGSTAPINGANPAPSVSSSQPGANGSGGGVKRESITNFEVDKTVRVTRAGGGNGSIKRLTAAVVVNYQPSTGDKGQAETKALAPEQLEQMTALVRETIGYNKDRGDSVNLMNTPFQPEKPIESLPLWKQPETVELAKSFAWPLGIVLFALVVLFGLVRPALRQPKLEEVQEAVAIAEARSQLDALENGDLDRPALGPKEAVPTGPSAEELRLEEARLLALENPIAVANILKTWVNGEAP